MLCLASLPIRLCLFAALIAGAAPAHAESADAAAAQTGGMSRAEAYRLAAEMAEIGRALFNDVALSGSGRMACATCHDPAHAFGPANALAVQLGGKDMRQPGVRSVPSLTYIQTTPQFTLHYYESEDEGDPTVDGGPTGGLTWDGRANRGRDQARIPLLSRFEMANDNEAEIVAKVRRASYADAIRHTFGKDVFDRPGAAFDAVLQSLEAYEQSYKEFFPYTSKYDAYLRGQAKLSETEAHGLALFADEAKGNCASCHHSQRAANGLPQFTDSGMIALGLPRNAAIPANADPNYHDLGLCGPLRTDLTGHDDYCGLFKTPSLRNIALKQVFFHNGSAHTLREAVAFYVERDTKPEKWYPRNPDGSVRKYDDLPAKYQENVNTDPPFGGKPGDKPALSDAEIDDIVAFLKTLTDGYSPQP
jgi:cytochrome c peroxidase